MKKRIALVLFMAVLLLITVVGGVSGRNGHVGANRDKILGHGMVGNLAVYNETSLSAVWFTNPDCQNDIAINKVTIIRGDGTLIYEGPYVRMPEPGEGDYQVISVIKPHEIRIFLLARYMWTGAGDSTNPTAPNNRTPGAEPMALPWAVYTV